MIFPSNIFRFIGFFLIPTLILAQDKELIIRQGHRDMINMVKYSLDGTYVFTAGEDGVIKMWDVNTGIDVKSFTGHESGVKCMEISSDGNRMISGDATGNILVWDIEGMQSPVKRISAHSDAVNVIKYLPSQSSFLSGSSDKFIKQWNSHEYSLMKTFEGITGEVKSIGISPDGQRMIMGGQRTNDVELLLIDVESGAILDDALKHVKGAGAAKALTYAILTPFAAAASIGKGDVDKNMLAFYVFNFSNIEFTKDGGSVLISQNLFLPMMAAKEDEEKTGGTTISIVELNADRTMFKDVTKPKRWMIDYPTSKALFNEDQSRIIVNIKNSIKIYDMENADFPEDLKEAGRYEPPLLKEFTGNISWLTSIAISPDYRTVASSGEDMSLDLWDIESGRRFRRLEGYVQPALAIEVMPDGKHIVVGTRHKNMAVWDITTGRLVRSFDRSPDVNHIDISPDGKYMVTTALDTRFFKLWNIRTGNILGTFMEKKDDIIWVEFDEDPEYILAATETGELKKWSKDDKKIKKNLKENYTAYDHRNKLGNKLIEYNGNRITITENGNSVTSEIQLGNITDVIFTIDGTRAISTNDMGEIIIYDLNKKEKIISMALIDDFDFITYTPDYYYTSSKGAAKAIAFRDGDNILPFEQMEIRFNRPDVVAERLGMASPKLIASYKSAYEKRLKRLGYSADDLFGEISLPVVKIDERKYPLATEEMIFRYKVEASDKFSNIEKINVHINDVPVFGYNGIEVSSPGKELSMEVEVDLSSGLNEIKTVAVNAGGLESIPHVMEINYQGPYHKPDLYLVSVGVSKYQSADYNLSFAAKDAEEVVAFFSRSEVFASVHTKILTDVNATAENFGNLDSFLSQAEIDDVLIVFIAGHGVLDADYNYYFGTYDMDFQNPSNGGFAYDILEEMIINSRCRNKLLFMDTCHSGELDKDEVVGVKEAAKMSGQVAFRSGGGIIQYKEDAFGLENTLELSKNLFGDLRKGTGATIIAAAGGTEFALEGLGSSNGLFTSSMMEGVKTRRADLNRDRMYTVSEFRQYISDRVVNLSRGQQVPTSREENLKNDFRIY